MEKIIVAQFFIKPENIEDFKRLTTGLIKKTREEEGNTFYHLYQSVEDQTSFIFYEIFEGQEGIDFHLNTAHYKEFASSLVHLQSKEPILKIMD
ncbi:MAG TPA: antibiotic biosynthesis monooxygenase [Dysgonomonas sp.]|nr:antibiotic biosynthesis monooxygenase [Dysgonomonas sp.]